MNDFKKIISDYICSGHALLYIDTFEKDRVVSELVEVAGKLDNRKVFIWSLALGWTNDKGIRINNIKQTSSDDNPLPNIEATAPVDEQLQAIFNFPGGAICILRDFGPFIQHDTCGGADLIISWLDELRKIIASVRQTIIFVGPVFSSPKPLLHDITLVDFDLPVNKQIEERINFVCEDVTRPDGAKFKIDPKMIPQIVDACRGMTSCQIGDRVALALRKHGDLNDDAIHTIVHEKAAVIRASELLNYIEPPEGGLANVGGYEALKQHVLLDKPCFTDEAREFGIEFPRGLMLVGIPGCGKTLLSMAIASELGLPLIAMDVGNLMSKYVGDSENNMREAIRMLESMGSIVLVLDEIEKGFGGTGDMDGGSSRRVFGTFLKWMNDRQSPIYIIATANQIESLPIEFTRKGRLDEIYGLDLPEAVERQEIFHIHLIKRDRKPKDFNVTELVNATIGFTGSDIEQVIKLSLKIAFADNKKLQQKHLMQAASEIIPLSKTASDRIDIIRAWCEKHAKPANPKEKVSPPKIGKRKVDLNKVDLN